MINKRTGFFSAITSWAKFSCRINLIAIIKATGSQLFWSSLAPKVITRCMPNEAPTQN
jgi:hypothetical protein